MGVPRSLLVWWLGVGLVGACRPEDKLEDEDTSTTSTTSTTGTTSTTSTTGTTSSTTTPEMDSTGVDTEGGPAGACSHILEIPTYGVRCFGSPNPDVPFGCAYVNGQGNQQEVVVFDSMCNPIGPHLVNTASETFVCAMSPDGEGGTCVNRNDSSSNLIELDAGWVPQAPVEIPILPGSFILWPLPAGSSHGEHVLWTLNACCGQLSASLVDGTTLVQTWESLTTFEGGMSDISVILDGDSMLTWTAELRESSFLPDPSGWLRSGALDLSAGPSGSVSSVEVAPPTPEGAPGLWDSLTNEGSWERVYRVTENDSVLAVTDYLQPDLPVDSMYDIQLDGGRVLGFHVVRTPSGREFMLAEVVVDGEDDAGIRLYELPDPPEGTIDAASGELVDDGWTSIKDFYANDHGLVIVLGVDVLGEQRTLFYFVSHMDL